MKITIIRPNSVNVNPWIPEFRKNGIEVFDNDFSEEDVDFVIGASHSQYARLKHYNERFPDVPMINYNWDLYEWFDLSQPMWSEYRNLLDKSVDIWCPSEEVVMRTEEFFGLGAKCNVIKTFARFFEYAADVEDHNFVYQPMRPYVKDRNYGWVKKATKELNIPLFESNHSLSESDFQKRIANCTFLVCEYYEASTGGLTLLEGHRLGKPVLVSDSPYMGAKDYFGDRANYFKHDDYEDFKKKISEMWNSRKSLDRSECIEFTNRYSLENMVKEMIERMKVLKSGQE
jgi:glycosyltransferase involved in cell wall biosynthesis